jgi:signal transduction histidine kinase
VKLARRIVLALALLAGLIIATLETVEARRELADEREERVRQHVLLGRAAGASFAQALERGGEAEARATVEGASGARPGVQLRWVWLEPAAPPARPLPPRLAPPGPAPGGGAPARSEPWSEVDASGAVARLVTYVPLRAGAGGRLGAVMLTEPLAHERTQLRNTVVRTALATLATAGLFLLASMVLGRRLVGRPVERLVDMARRIARGDLTAQVPAGGRDELDELARAMNEMGRALREARAQLEQETAARLAMLERLRHTDRLSTVGKLASGVAHELGTPLNVVQGRARLVLDGDVEGEAALASVRVIHEQAGAMARIIRQLLDFAGRRAPEPVAHEAGALVSRTLEMLRPLAHKRGVQLSVDCPAPLTLEVDAAQLQQVLTNLVINGVQATHGPGEVAVRVAAETRPPPAAPPGSPGREWVVLTVEDAGAGIPPDVLPRIFEPFFTTKDVGEGTGLGLSVSWGLVEDHGGFILVDSTPGEGSRFRVYLPRARAAAAA